MATLRGVTTACHPARPLQQSPQAYQRHMAQGHGLPLPEKLGRARVRRGHHHVDPALLLLRAGYDVAQPVSPGAPTGARCESSHVPK